MARPHHRKGHKEHLRQFQKNRESFTSDAKAKGTNIFAIVGAVVGLAITYFASQGNIIWVISGLVIGAASGYFAGKGIENSSKN